MTEKNNYEYTTTVSNLGNRPMVKTTKTKDNNPVLRVSDFVIWPSTYQAFFTGLAGFGGFMTVVLLLMYFLERGHPLMLLAAGMGFGLFCAGVAFSLRLSSQAAFFRERYGGQETETREEITPESTRTGAAEFARIRGPLGTAVITQEEPGAFASLARKVLDKGNRTAFSTRNCAAHKLDYQNVIGELRKAGILHPSKTENHSPALTAEGEKALNAFIHGRPYPAQ